MDPLKNSVEYFQFEKALEKAILQSARLNQHSSAQYYIEKWQAFCRDDQQEAYIYLRAGNILSDEGKHDWAAKLYQKGLQITSLLPTLDYQLNLRLAFVQVQMDELKKAGNHARASVEIYPDQAGGYLVLGLVLESVKDFDLALDFYIKAATLPVHDQTWIDRLGNYYCRQNEFRLGGQPGPDLPAFPASLRIAAALLVLSGQEGTSSIPDSLLQSKLHLAEEDWLSLYRPLASEMFLSSNNLEVSGPFMLQKLFTYNPDSTFQLTKAGRDTKKRFPQSPSKKSLTADMNGYITPEGLMIYKDYLEARTRFLGFLNMTFGLCLDRNDRERAEGRLDQMLQLSFTPREYALYWLKKGSALERFKEYGAGAIAYQKGVAFEHDDQQLNYFLRNNAAYCLVQVGEYMDAEPLCRDAIDIRWDQHNAHKNLGLSLKGQGRFPEAAESFRNATLSNPFDRRAFNHLRELLGNYPDLEITHPEYQEFIESAGFLVENAHLIVKVIKFKEGDPSTLTRPLQILIAAVQVAGDTGRKVFTADELRGRNKIEKKVWELSYIPLLREMSNGDSDNGNDELIGFRGVFQLEGLDELRFTERGKEMAQLVGVIIKG